MAKTVICTECGAEQAICRDDEGKMKCAFCSCELELPEYEEGEELTDYITPIKRIEPIGDAIEIEYVLTADEVEEALFSTGKIRERKLIPIIETVFCGIFIIMQGISIGCGLAKVGKYPMPRFSDWLLLVIMGALIPLVWYLPKKTKKDIVKRSTTGSTLNVKMFENIAEVVVNGDQNDSWYVEYGKDYEILESEKLINVILINEGKKLLVLPKRAILDADMENVMARLNTKIDDPAIIE